MDSFSSEGRPSSTDVSNAAALLPHALDPAGVSILSILQDSARIANVALAARVGMTAAPCLRRVRRLEEEGYILGYHARLNARKLGFEVTGFVSVSLESQAQRHVLAFESLIESCPLVRECYAINGDVDFLIKCVARDLTQFQQFVTETLMRTPNVKTVRSSLVIHTSKLNLSLPLAEHGTPTA
jgi:DNA-binding Lrp family transcriptional regulator